ncbi:LysE family translocator [Amycolatopsis sp. NPDC005003]
MPRDFGAYLVVAVLVVVVPGPDFVLIVRTATAYGRRPGLHAGLGVVSGLLVQGVAAAFGLAGLVAGSAVLFDGVRLAGATYLGWLGVQALRSAASSADAPAPGRGEAGRAYRQGLFTNVTNPKVLVFYLSLLAQFVDHTRPALPQVLVLAAAHAVIGLLWTLMVLGAVGRAQRVLDRPRAGRWVSGLAGLAFLGLALRLVLTGGLA